MSPTMTRDASCASTELESSNQAVNPFTPFSDVKITKWVCWNKYWNIAKYQNHMIPWFKMLDLMNVRLILILAVSDTKTQILE